MGLLCNFSKGLQSIHLIFLNICELSFNRDFAHCCRAFDMSNKYYLLTYLLTYLYVTPLFGLRFGFKSAR